MFFRQILHEEKSCLSYLVGCSSRHACAVVDAQADPQTYIDTAKRHDAEITAVIETHIQADHISTSWDLAKKTGAVLYFGPEAHVNWPHTTLHNNQILPVGNRRIRAIHTPGHTPEHLCLVVDDWFVLTGDTLFVGDVGRVDLTEKTQAGVVKIQAHQLYNSVQKLLKLSDWIEVYPGHYGGSLCGKGIDGKPSSTIGHERRFNKVLAFDKEAFTDYLVTDMPKTPNNFVEIKRQNTGEGVNIS